MHDYSGAHVSAHIRITEKLNIPQKYYERIENTFGFSLENVIVVVIDFEMRILF